MYQDNNPTHPDRASKAIVGGPIFKRAAPKLLLRMECPKCKKATVVDVYLGVVMCGKCPNQPFMLPIEIVEFPCIDSVDVVAAEVPNGKLQQPVRTAAEAV